MALALGLLTPRPNETGQCLRVLSDKRLVVRPTYDARHEHTKEYTDELEVDFGSLSFSCSLTMGMDLKLKHNLAATYAPAEHRMLDVRQGVCQTGHANTAPYRWVRESTNQAQVPSPRICSRQIT